MGRKCSVYNCRTGYKTKSGTVKGTVYRFPSKRFPKEQKQWIDALPNFGFEWTENCGICDKHWPANVPTKAVQGGHVRPTEPPMIFTDVPPSCVPKPAPKERKKNSFAERNAQPDELDEFLVRDAFNPSECVEQVMLACPDCVCYKLDNNLCVKSKSRQGSVAAFTVFVNLVTMIAECYWGVLKVSVPLLSNNKSITAVSQLQAITNFLVNYENKDERVRFVTRQIELLNDKRFSPDDLATSFRLRALGSAAYDQFRELLVLPSGRLLRRLTSGVAQLSNVEYYSAIFSNLTDLQRNCVLMVDEMFVKPSLQYQGRQMFGESVNRPGEVATRLLVVMVRSLCGGPSFCLQLLPVVHLSADYLVAVITDSCKLIEKCGGKIICVVADNHRVNQRAFALLANDQNEPWLAQSPACPSRALFLLSDPVHLMKNVRNSWITEKSERLVFHALDSAEPQMAHWSAVRHLYEAERCELFRQSHLTSAAVSPNPIQRQSVPLVLKVFCDETAAALRLRGENSTAAFVEIFVKFWKLMNVRAPSLDQRYNDKYRSVISADEPWQFDFLRHIADLAHFMAPEHARNRDQTLCADTARWLRFTCLGVISVCKFLFHEGFSYVMLGEFSTDLLEKEFGKFRQACGGVYLITVRNVIDKYRLDRARLLSSVDPSMLRRNSDDDRAHSCASCVSADYDFISVLPLLADEIPGEIKQTLVYVSGFLCKTHEGLRMNDTTYEYIANGSYQDELDRGKLTVPVDGVVHFVYYMYITFLVMLGDDKPKPCFFALVEAGRLINDYFDLVDDDSLSVCCRTVCNILLNNCSSNADSLLCPEARLKVSKLTK